MEVGVGRCNFLQGESTQDYLHIQSLKKTTRSWYNSCSLGVQRWSPRNMYVFSADRRTLGPKCTELWFNVAPEPVTSPTFHFRSSALTRWTSRPDHAQNCDLLRRFSFECQIRSKLPIMWERFWKRVIGLTRDSDKAYLLPTRASSGRVTHRLRLSIMPRVTRGHSLSSSSRLFP